VVAQEKGKKNWNKGIYFIFFIFFFISFLTVFPFVRNGFGLGG